MRDARKINWDQSYDSGERTVGTDLLARANFEQLRQKKLETTGS